MNGDPMPDGLTSPEQTLYLQLRMLYSQYRSGLVSREQAKEEKRMLCREFDNNKYKEKMYRYWVEQTRRTEGCKNAYMKNKTIENADRLVRVLDGETNVGSEGAIYSAV